MEGEYQVLIHMLLTCIAYYMYVQYRYEYMHKRIELKAQQKENEMSMYKRCCFLVGLIYATEICFELEQKNF